MHLRSVFSIFLSLVFLSSLISQSGWTRKKGHFFAKLDLSALNATTYYDHDRVSTTTVSFNQGNINFYGEYGLTDRIAITAAMPLVRSNYYFDSYRAIGIGDLRLDFKYRLTSNDLPISLIIAPELPIGKSENIVGRYMRPNEFVNLPNGDGEFNVWTGVAASKSFGKMYASAFGMYNFRTKYKGNSLVDLYQFGAEIGVSPLNKLWINTKLRAQFATDKPKNLDIPFLIGDGTTYTLLSFEVSYKVTDHLGFSLAYFTGGNWISPFSNIYIAPFRSIGVFYEH